MEKSLKYQGNKCNNVVIMSHLLRLLFCIVSVKRLPVLWFNKLPFIPRDISLCIIEVSLETFLNKMNNYTAFDNNTLNTFDRHDDGISARKQTQHE